MDDRRMKNVDRNGIVKEFRTMENKRNNGANNGSGQDGISPPRRPVRFTSKDEPVERQKASDSFNATRALHSSLPTLTLFVTRLQCAFLLPLLPGNNRLLCRLQISLPSMATLFYFREQWGRAGVQTTTTLALLDTIACCYSLNSHNTHRPTESSLYPFLSSPS